MSAELHTQAGGPAFLLPHAFAGTLIAAEGLDGSGKSTQFRLLKFWLQAEGYEVITTELVSSKLIKRALKAGKKQGNMDSMLLSVLHAVDFAELYEREIVPALKRGSVVLADRYVYTALARDVARGVEQDWIQSVYSFAVRPDLSIYFQLSVDESLERTISQQERVKYYQAGLDLGLSRDPTTSFRAFQQRILQVYESMIDLYHLLRLDATLPIKQQQQILRDAIAHVLSAE